MTERAGERDDSRSIDDTTWTRGEVFRNTVPCRREGCDYLAFATFEPDRGVANALCTKCGFNWHVFAPSDERLAALRESEKGERIDPVAMARDKRSVLNIRVYPYSRVYAWWRDDEDEAAEGNGDGAFEDALRLLHDSEPRLTEGPREEDTTRSGGWSLVLPDDDNSSPVETDVGEQEDEDNVIWLAALMEGLVLCMFPEGLGDLVTSHDLARHVIARLTVSGEPLGEDVRERFWSKVPDRPEHGCWEWASTIHPKGYGHFYCDGRQRYAHRVSFRMAYDHIPTGFQVMHRCDNRKCVRPDHLTVGTNADNVADMVSKRRQNYGEKNPNSVFTEDDVRHIRSSDEASAELAAQYDVAPQTINKIRRGERWSHVGTVSATEGGEERRSGERCARCGYGVQIETSEGLKCGACREPWRAELLPCPFCGGDADTRFVHTGPVHRAADVGCLHECELYFRRWSANDDDEDQEAMDAAVRAWNRRSATEGGEALDFYRWLRRDHGDTEEQLAFMVGGYLRDRAALRSTGEPR